MKKLLKLTAVALLATSTSLMAQMAGPSVAVSLSAAKGTTDGTSTSGNNNNTSASISRTFRIASLDLDYAQKFNNDWGMSYGINYIPFKGKIADVSRNDTNLGGSGSTQTGTATAKGELKKHFTLYVEPTYMLNKDSGIYAKLGYVHADLEINSTTVIASPAGTTVNDTVKIHGIQYGLGYKTALSNNLYGKIEATVNNYNDVSYTKVGEETNTFTANPEVRQVTISVGYTF
jgi:opacity protein-like surface antigen